MMMMVMVIMMVVMMSTRRLTLTLTLPTSYSFVHILTTAPNRHKQAQPQVRKIVTLLSVQLLRRTKRGMLVRTGMEIRVRGALYEDIKQRVCIGYK